MRAELQAELDDMILRVDEAQGVNCVQIEMNKKREAEMARLRHELEVGV